MVPVLALWMAFGMSSSQKYIVCPFYICLANTELWGVGQLCNIDRQTDRQTGRQAGRQTDRQTGRPHPFYFQAVHISHIGWMDSWLAKTLMSSMLLFT